MNRPSFQFPNDDLELDLFSCPVCYEPLVRKGPPGLNLPAIYRSGFKCKTCNKSYSSKDMYLDLTITAGSKDYNELELSYSGVHLFHFCMREAGVKISTERVSLVLMRRWASGRCQLWEWIVFSKIFRIRDLFWSCCTRFF